MPDYIIETEASLFSVVGLFGSTLQQLLAVPELALFLGTALLLILRCFLLDGASGETNVTQSTAAAARITSCCRGKLWVC